jgi:hypothetical protein
METMETTTLGTATGTALRLNLTSTTELTNFLNKFKPISGSLLIEIEGGYLKAKTHTPERSVVKASKIELSRVFEFEGEVEEKILFGVYSLEKLIKSFSHFEGAPLTFTLRTEKTADGVVGTDIILQNDSLTINFQCATLRLFTHITDELMDRISDTSSAQIDFVLTKELQARINSLAAIDSDQKLLTLKLNNGALKASSKSFDLNLLTIDTNEANLDISVYKTQFAFLDKEDAKVYMNEDRLIVHSIETDTKTIIGKAE